MSEEIENALCIISTAMELNIFVPKLTLIGYKYAPDLAAEVANSFALL